MKDRRLYKERAEYIKSAVTKRRQKIKMQLIAENGGKCMLCGYSKYSGALEFHHREPSKKDFSLAKSGLTRSLQRMRDEARKCILVCSNCHKEIHANLTQLSREISE